MDQKQVNMIIDYKGVQKLRPLLLRFRSKSSSFNVQKIESGNYRGKILIKFFVVKEHYDTIVQKLQAQNILVVADEELKANFQRHLAPAENLEDSEARKLRQQIPSINIEELDELLKEGKAEEVLNHSRDIIEQGNELINSVNSILGEAALNEIKNQKEKVKSDAESKLSGFKKLLSIASDETIHGIEDSKISEIAGDEAINICLEDNDLITELINISNNINLHSKVNLKAAIRFSEKVFGDDGDFSKELEIAVDSLNLLWLNFAREVFQKDFSEIELGSFNRLVSYISKKREGVRK